MEMALKRSLADMQLGHSYRLVGFNSGSPDYHHKLYKMGFVEGTPVELASVKISDPIVVHIRGSRVALRKKEADLIVVEEM
jgi:ferrous iron transport protein A